MKNKAFTLIELMAVVVIISLICLLTFPNIVKQIKKSEDQNRSNTEKIILLAAKKYISDNPDKYEDNKCIAIKTLIDNDYLKEDVADGIQYDFVSYIDEDYVLSDECSIEN